MQVFMKRMSWVVAVAALAIYTSNAWAIAYDEMYEMNAAPDTVAGTTFGHVLEVATGGSGTNGPSGFVFSGGIGTFLDDGASSGNQGYWSGAAGGAGAWMQASSNFTVDFYMKVLQDDTPGTGKSMSFWSGNGRGLKINLGGSSFVNGSGNVGSVGPGAADWTQFRVIIDGAANTAIMYTSTDGDVNNGNGDNVEVTNSGGMGGSGFAYGPPINFAIGSHSGSGTTQSNFQMDWWRVAEGATGIQTAYTPEPASLALLTLGAIPMMIRRRRSS